MIETFDTLTEAQAEAERCRPDWPAAAAAPLETLTGTRLDTGRFVVVLSGGYHTPDARCNAPKRHGTNCQFVPPLVSHTDGRLVYLN